MSATTGVIGVGGTATVDVSAYWSGQYREVSLSLDSAAAGRSIALMIGSDPAKKFTPAVDAATAGQLVLSVSSPVDYVIFTGNAGDVWRVM